MEPWHWGVLLKPFLFLILYLGLIFPLARAIKRVLPEGRLKRLLSREMTRPEASERDKIIATLLILGAFAATMVYGAYAFNF